MLKMLLHAHNICFNEKTLRAIVHLPFPLSVAPSHKQWVCVRKKKKTDLTMYIQLYMVKSLLNITWLMKSSSLKMSTSQYSVIVWTPYWQQEMTCLILWCTPPSRLTRCTSNMVRKALRFGWCFIVKTEFSSNCFLLSSGKFRCIAMKQEVVRTHIYIVQSASNFTCLIRVPAWTHLHDNIPS